MKTNRLLITALAFALSWAGTAFAAEPIAVDEQNPTVTQDFNSATDENLPAGWAIDVNRDATRTIRSWADAESKIISENTKGCFVGPSLASNEKNGPYYFYETEKTTDYAVGGITTGTGTANGADCISLMTALKNDGTNPIDRLNVSYAIEKYRYGNNEAGWEVSLHYSLDGSNWTAAGDAFKNLYPKDSETNGAAIVPILTDKVENQTLMVDVAPDQTLYLAWMMSVASGTQGSGAQVFGIDDVELTVSYAQPDAHYIYVENATRLNSLSLFAPEFPAYYGEKPGTATSLTKVVNGVTYSVWSVVGSEGYDVTVMAGNNEVGTQAVAANADTYLCASPSGLSVIDNPESYTGWVDPNRPPFVASGIYIRGEINNWGSPAEWEFSKETESVYVLYDKVLSGQFKVADSSWSNACNYGSNGSNIMVDEDYFPINGTDVNISCGKYTFTCSRIVLTIVEGAATLYLEADDSETGLTSVYMVGDFNAWDYSNTAGELKLDDNDGLFKGRASMTPGDSGLSNWLVYLRLGKAGAYGAGDDEGILVKGSTVPVATKPATYDVTFDLSTGAYTLTEVESEPAVLVLNPANTVLVPENPETVKVLSLNNSLIHYNDQARMFNEIASAMEKDATWTKHTNLGKTLQYHWEEGDGLTPDGLPGAKMVVRSDAWSHIILQEQTALPRTNLESFRSSVKQWVDYIRENCPNPNAVIILPMNWHYAQDWSNFDEYNKRLMSNYAAVASEMGVVVCPVAVAYQAKFEKDGGSVTETEWFLPGDDRHPTIRATYMAACMEYGLIFNEDPANITFWPDYTTEYDSKKIDATVAEDMRKYASDALKAYKNAVNHHAGTIQFESSVYDDFGIKVDGQEVTFTVDGGGTITNDGLFTSDGTRGTFKVTATSGDFTKEAVIVVADAETEVIVYPSVSISIDSPTISENFNSLGLDAEATLPEGWRIDRQTVAPRTLGTFPLADEATMYAGGTNLPSNAKNGLWNFGADGSDDRALGGITTGVDNGTRAVNIYTHLLNDGTKPFGSLNIAYDIEKYRKGANAAGFAVQMYWSYDGRSWTSAGDDFRTVFEKDNATEGYAEVPGEVKSVEATLPINFGGGMDLYLAWNISAASGTDCSAAPALALDNVVIEGVAPAVPEFAWHIYVDDQTTYDALGLYAWSSSAAVSEIFGAWPGQAPIDEQEIDGITYKVFGHDADSGSYFLIFNNWNQGKQLADFAVEGGKDYYLTVTDSQVLGVEAVEGDGFYVSYTGTEVRSSVPAVIEVFSVDGAKVVTAYGTSVGLDSLSPAFYIVKATSDNATKVMKIRR